MQSAFNRQGQQQSQQWEGVGGAAPEPQRRGAVTHKSSFSRAAETRSPQHCWNSRPHILHIMHRAYRMLPDGTSHACGGSIPKTIVP